MRLAEGALAVLVFVTTFSSLSGAAEQDVAPVTTCASLTAARMPNVRITEAETMAAAGRGPVTVAHCRVSGVIDTEIGFVALLPDRWNGRFFAGGGGGFGGTVENQAQASVNLGYATVGTDTGHQAAGSDGSWVDGRRDRLVNYAHRGVHRTAEIAKTVIEKYYGRRPSVSFFFGLSNGGREALMEVQRYPADFDGVVAVAPSFNMTEIAAAFVRNTQASFPDPRVLGTSVITPDVLKLLDTTILQACDGLDGVRDGVLDDPRDCRFSLDSLPACSEDRAAGACVTSMQRHALERIYAPVIANGVRVYPGQPFGGEGAPGGWQNWITGVNRRIATTAEDLPPSLSGTFAVQFFRHFVFARPDWNYGTYDLSMVSRDTKSLAPIVNADDANLSRFESRGGKLILAHGWADPAINPLATIAYYERLASHDRRASEHVRLFMMPGVLHGVGGPGPDSVDWFTAIADWVERGRAPEQLVAAKRGPDGQVLNTRPLCAFPRRAIYDGHGVTTDAGSFVCATVQ